MSNNLTPEQEVRLTRLISGAMTSPPQSALDYIRLTKEAEDLVKDLQGVPKWKRLLGRLVWTVRVWTFSVKLAWHLLNHLLLFFYAVSVALTDIARYVYIWHDTGPELTRRVAVRLKEESRRRRSARLRMMAIWFARSYRKELERE